MKTAGYTILGIAAFFAIGLVLWVLGVGGSLAATKAYSITAPAQASAERKVFTKTPSYTLGKDQDISRYKLEYELKKDPADKNAIKSIILDDVSTVDINDLTPDNQDFVRSLK